MSIWEECVYCCWVKYSAWLYILGPFGLQYCSTLPFSYWFSDWAKEPLLNVGCWSLLLPLYCCLFLPSDLSMFALYIQTHWCYVHKYCRFLSSCWVDFSIIMWRPSLTLVTVFDLKSILSHISVAIPALFWLPFARNIFFPFLHYLLCVFLNLKWISQRQHVVGSFFRNQSSHSISIKRLNSTKFKVIIDS